MMNPVIFREYDIRGVYKKDFDIDFARNLGRGYVSFVTKQSGVSSPRICIGYDARLSSPQLAEAVCDGLSKSGAHAVNLGLVTTPISYFSTFFLDKVDGAIMITGSHNPPEYNGFKISVGKSTIFGQDIQKLRKLIEEEDFVSGTGDISSYDIFPEYIRRYKEEFGDLGDIQVVFDCGNGAAGCVVRKLAESVGLKPNILFEEPDGRFPNHHPDPTVAENLTTLIEAVKRSNARVGIGFDGDADRIGVVDDRGNVILGDDLMVLISRSILNERAGATIVGDVKCSDRLYHDIDKHGGQPLMWKTGHSLIKSKIKEVGAPFGGELSGHFFFADRNYGFDDAIYAGLRVIEILAKSGKTVGELLDSYPTAYNTPEIRIDTTEEKKHQIVEKLKQIYSKPSSEFNANLIDGIRVSFRDGWALARASNTQPVLVLRFEANTQAALKNIQEEFEKIIHPLL